MHFLLPFQLAVCGPRRCGAEPSPLGVAEQHNRWRPGAPWGLGWGLELPLLAWTVTEREINFCLV